jgi:hypothetical protein
LNRSLPVTSVSSLQLELLQLQGRLPLTAFYSARWGF